MRKISSLGFLLSGLQLSQAINVYLYPPQPFLRSTLSPDDASSALSRHLGLESFEPLRDASTATYSEENFVGQGSSNALLLTLEELDAKAVLPDSLKPSFKLSIPPSSSISSLTSVITTYLHRAKHSYNSVYDSYPHFTEIHDLQSFFDKAHSSAFAALELHDLAEIRSKYGPESENYILAADMTRAFLLSVYFHFLFETGIQPPSLTGTISSAARTNRLGLHVLHHRGCLHQRYDLMFWERPMRRCYQSWADLLHLCMWKDDHRAGKWDKDRDLGRRKL